MEVFTRRWYYIVDWICATNGGARFRVAPATLTFHDVTDLRVSFDFGGSGPLIEIVQQQFQNVAPKAVEASMPYMLLERLGRADDLAVVGVTLGQPLLVGWHPEEGLVVLRRSMEMYTRLGQTKEAQQVKELICYSID